MFNEMIEYLKSMMRTPSADVLAFRELEEAKRLSAYLQSTMEAK